MPTPERNCFRRAAAPARLSSEPGAANTTFIGRHIEVRHSIGNFYHGFVYSYRTPMFIVSLLEPFQSS
jgi:hypothetical protein